MSIANELSSEVAAAVLTGREDDSAINPSELIDVVVKVHSTLRNLTIEARKRNRRSRTTSPAPPSSSSAAASGTH